MSIRVYSATDELVGNTATKRKCARFELLLAARYSSLSKPVMRKVEFTVAGTTDAAVEAAAVTIAEEIIALSAGQIMKFTKVMGHYRQDAVIPVIAVNQKSFGIIGHSPDPADGLEAVNLAIRIPFFNGSVADAQNVLGQRDLGATGIAAIGYVRWEDQSETELEAMYSEYLRGVNIIDMENVHNEPLATDNVADGLGDSGSLDRKL